MTFENTFWWESFIFKSTALYLVDDSPQYSLWNLTGGSIVLISQMDIHLKMESRIRVAKEQDIFMGNVYETDITIIYET